MCVPVQRQKRLSSSIDHQGVIRPLCRDVSSQASANDAPTTQNMSKLEPNSIATKQFVLKCCSSVGTKTTESYETGMVRQRMQIRCSLTNVLYHKKVRGLTRATQPHERRSPALCPLHAQDPCVQHRIGHIVSERPENPRR